MLLTPHMKPANVATLPRFTFLPSTLDPVQQLNTRSALFSTSSDVALH